MNRIVVDIPEETSGDFYIQKVTTNHLAGRDEPQGAYTVLHKGDYNVDNIMQDTTHEYDEHQSLWDNATGDVLIGGLGIGFVNQKLIDNPNVTSVTIVEKYQEVIDLVWEHCPKDETFTLIHADILIWEPTQNFNVAWFDTWLHWDVDFDAVPIEDYNDILIEKYTSYCDWIGCWPF